MLGFVKEAEKSVAWGGKNEFVTDVWGLERIWVPEMKRVKGLGWIEAL